MSTTTSTTLETCTSARAVFRFVWIAVALLVVLGGLAMFVLPGGPFDVRRPNRLGDVGGGFGWAPCP
ncbi:MAG: hypothetical protein M3O70_02360 [Actinomycetota bacterium]|nr:hypothetical protein [Actinomycetota bacterium]